MAEQIFLRVPPDSAKDQLKKRIDVYVSDSSNYEPAQKQRHEWHLVNVRVLESIFSSDQVANDYKERLQRALKNGKFEHETRLEARKSLQDIIDRLPLFPQMPQQEKAVAAAISRTDPPPVAPRGPVQEIQWEFHSVIVDDPSLGKHIEKPNYHAALKALSEEGWDLVNAIPVIYTEEKNQLFPQTYVEAYRLFFKRPRRL